MRTSECSLDEEILQIALQIACTFVERVSGSDVVDLEKGVNLLSFLHFLKKKKHF